MDAGFTRHGKKNRKCLRHAAASLIVSFVALCADAATAADAGVYHNGDYEFAVGPAPVWVRVHDVPDKWDGAAPGSSNAHWRNWLVDGQVDRRAGGRIRYSDTAYEPVSSELVQDAGKYQIWFSPEYQKLTIHRVEIRRDGKWSDRLVPKAITLARRESDFERDMANGMVSALIVLNDVRAGDVVRVSYSLDGENPVLAGLVDENFVFAASEPILDRHVRVLFDSKARLIDQHDPGAPKPTQKRTAEALEWGADAHAIHDVINEGSYPAWYDPAPAITVGERREWAEIAGWARTLYPSPKPLPAELEQRIAEWRKLPAAEQRLAAALRAVQEEIRYFGIEMGANTHRPSEPAETWTRRYGDCKDKARLLATVLGHLGIEAQPALVSYEHGKAIAELPPAASLFDHVIVKARLGETTLWLDATQTQQRGSPLSRDPGSFGVALPVADGVKDLVSVSAPTAAIDRLHVVEHVRPNPAEASVSLEVDSEYEGAAADRMRRRLKANGNDKIEREFIEYYRKRYGDVSLSSAFAVADDEMGNRLKVNERYLLKNPWIDSGVGKRSLGIYADALSSTLSLPKTAVRLAPLRVEYPIELEQQTLLELPEGWQWLGESNQRRLTDAALEYELKTTLSGRVVSVNQRLRALRDVVEPSDYSKHFAMLREANDLLGQRMNLSVSAKENERERDKRLENVMRNVLDNEHSGDAKGNH